MDIRGDQFVSRIEVDDPSFRKGSMPRHRGRAPATRQWNVIVTARGDRLPEARRGLRAIGRVERTGFYNVLAMNVEELQSFLPRLERLVADDPGLRESLASVFPAERCFDFSDAADFEAKAREAALGWVPRLAGKSFHVRVHRRGRKGTLVSPAEERFVADALLSATREMGDPARVTFDDPDAILLVQTIGGRAGIALHTRAEYHEHPLLATH
jgi:tRNA(Ser,Leu) C12 N-acetylase TAN1